MNGSILLLKSHNHYLIILHHDVLFEAVLWRILLIMQKQNIGNAGEYYFAARLSAENFIATITLGRAEKYDILALSPKGRSIKLSIKAQYLETSKGFPLSEKDEDGHSDDFYYVFIRLNEFKNEPDFWVIPSKVVCHVLKTSHAKWLAGKGKNDRTRNNSSLRKLPLVVSGSLAGLYPEKWEDDLEKYYKNIKQLSEK